MKENIEKNFMGIVRQKYGDIPAKQYSPLVLAYIGDAVYEVYIRTKIVAKGNMSVNKMNQEAKTYVKASEQARIYHIIENMLTDNEMAIFKRGRNAKSATMPKNALISDYKYATGLEALVGYLYIDGQLDRLIELLDKAIC